MISRKKSDKLEENTKFISRIRFDLKKYTKNPDN